MNALNDKVQIAGRFQRSVNIGADIGDHAALEGFICPRSSQQLLDQMANHISKPTKEHLHGLGLMEAANLV